MATLGRKTKGKRTGKIVIDLDKMRLVKGYDVVKRKNSTKKKK